MRCSFAPEKFLLEHCVPFFKSNWIFQKHFVNGKQPIVGLQIPIYLINPVSPKSDLQQFSPYSVNTQSIEKVRRINKMITNRKNTLIYNQIPCNYSQGNILKSVWRICVSTDVGTVVY